MIAVATETPQWVDSLRYDFLADLRAKRIARIDTRSMLNLEAWIEASAKRGLLVDEPSSARGAVRAILCKSPEEQQRFDVAFDAWIARFENLCRQNHDSGDSEKKTTYDITGRGRRWHALLTALAAIILAVASWLWVQSRNTPPDLGAPKFEPTTQSPETNDGPGPLPTPEADRTPIATMVALMNQIALPAPTIRLFGLDPVAYLLGASILGAAILLYPKRRYIKRIATPETFEKQEVFVRHHLTVSGSRRRLIRDAAKIIRSRRAGQRLTFDLGESVLASAAAAGMASLRFRRESAAYELLVLVDRQGTSDQQAFWAIESVRDVAAEGVTISLWEFDRDPRWVSPMPSKRGKRGESSGQYHHLQTLGVTRAQHGLIVFSDGDGLLDSRYGRLKPWVNEIFAPWPRRVLITPRPIPSWGPREDVLAGSDITQSEHTFLVLPQHSHSWLAAAVWLRHGALAAVNVLPGSPTRYPTILEEDPGRWLMSPSPCEEDRQAVLVALRDYLGADAFTWFAASAAYPVASAELVAFLAHHLSERTSPTNLPDAPRLLEARLVAIAQLPWCRHGYMPDWLRLTLFLSLPTPTRRKVRKLLQGLFDQTVLQEPKSAAISIGHFSKISAATRIRKLIPSVLVRAGKEQRLQDAIYIGVLGGSFDRELNPEASTKLLNVLNGEIPTRISANPFRWLWAAALGVWIVFKWMRVSAKDTSMQRRPEQRA